MFKRQYDAKLEFSLEGWGRGSNQKQPTMMGYEYFLEEQFSSAHRSQCKVRCINYKKGWINHITIPLDAMFA